MFGPEAWIQALAQADRPVWFTLSFSRLGLTAECRSLTAAEIGDALTLPGEAAARQLLYLACPSLQQAGTAMTEAGVIPGADHITEKLPYSDVLRAASLILARSGGGSGMVDARDLSEDHDALSAEGAGAFYTVPASGTTASEAAKPAEDGGLDGYSLLRQWAAEDRAAAAAFPQEDDAFVSTARLQQAWSEDIQTMRQRYTAGTPFLSTPAQAGVTADQVAQELCRRLCDAAGNM